MKRSNINDMLKKCSDCGKSITFQEFCSQNPSLKFFKARKLWDDPLITPYCPSCFINRPEKPFKIKIRHLNKYFLKES